MISHLSSLKQQDLISTWHDREIESGYWEPQIEQALEKADKILENNVNEIKNENIYLKNQILMKSDKLNFDLKDKR